MLKSLGRNAKPFQSITRRVLTLERRFPRLPNGNRAPLIFLRIVEALSPIHRVRSK